MRLLVRVALVLTALLIAPFYLEAFEVPKTELVRLLGVPALCVLLVPSVRSRRAASPLDLAVAAWLATEFLCTVLSVSPRLSLVGEMEQREGLITSLGLAGLYVAARLGTRDAKDGLRTLTVATTAIAAGCAYALLQAAGVDWFRWGRTSAGPAGFLRPFGTFGHPNLMGVMAAGALGALTTRLVFEPARRWLDGPLALVCGAALVFSVSRGGWIGGIAGMLTAGALALLVARGASERAPALTRRSIPVLAAAAVAIALLAASPIARIARVRFAEMFAPGTGSAASRIEIWRSAWVAFEARPWFGHGPDTFRLVFPRYVTARYSTLEWGAHPYHAHSIVFHTLATRGVLGALALLALAAAFATRAARLWRDGGANRVLAAAATSCAAGMLVAGCFGALGIAAQAALAVVAAALPDPGIAPRTAKSRREPAFAWSRGAQIATIVVGLAIVTVIVREAIASSEVRIARLISATNPPTVEAERNALRQQILRHDRRAVALAPWDSDLMRVIGEAETSLSRGGVSTAQNTAEWDLRRAVALEPHRAPAWSALELALLLRAAKGDARADSGSDSCYARARALSPNDPLVTFDRSGAELSLGRPAAALEKSQVLVARFPDVGPVLDLDSRALWVAGRRRESLAEMERAAAVPWPGPSGAVPWETRELRDWMRAQVADSLSHSHPDGAAPTPGSGAGSGRH